MISIFIVLHWNRLWKYYWKSVNGWINSNDDLSTIKFSTMWTLKMEELQNYVNIWNGFEIMHTKCTNTEWTNTHPYALTYMTSVLYWILLHIGLHIAQCHWITIVQQHNTQTFTFITVAFVQWHKSSLGNWLEYMTVVVWHASIMK